MNTTNFSDNYFTWFLPEEKPQYFITIPNERTLNLNEKLRKQINSPVEIGVSADGKALCIRPAKGRGFQALSSGGIKVGAVISALLRSGIRLPARYAVQEEAGRWIGLWVEPSEKTVSLQPRPKAPSARKRKTLEEELRGL